MKSILRIITAVLFASASLHAEKPDEWQLRTFRMPNKEYEWVAAEAPDPFGPASFFNKANAEISASKLHPLPGPEAPESELIENIQHNTRALPETQNHLQV